MFRKKIIFFIILLFSIVSCSGFEDVKKGLTGAKQKSTDEFLVQKKDPLILPPDFESLPTPTDRDEALEEMSTFEKKLTKTSVTETISSAEGSTEENILKRLPKETSTKSNSSTSSSAESSILERIKKK